jgi:hypothetical protein
MPTMPVLIPPLVKWAFAALGGAMVLHWAVKEMRRVNAELDRVRSAEAAARHGLPTLRRDPQSGDWRVG